MNKNKITERRSSILNAMVKGFIFNMDPRMIEASRFLDRQWQNVKVGKPYYRRRLKAFKELYNQLRSTETTIFTGMSSLGVLKDKMNIKYELMHNSKTKPFLLQ